MPSKQFDLLFIAGIVVSAILGFCLFMIVLTAGADFKDWLSFNGALIGAAVGAIGTFGATYLLISSQQKEAIAQKERELAAARALLASDLDMIIDYIHECVRTALTCTTTLARGGYRNTIKMPELNFDVMLRLGRLVVLAKPNESELISKVLIDLQVLRARLFGEISRFNGIERGIQHRSTQQDHHFNSAFSSMAQVYLRCIGLFEYARFRTNTANAPSLDEAGYDTAIRQLDLGNLDQYALNNIRVSILSVGERES